MSPPASSASSPTTSTARRWTCSPTSASLREVSLFCWARMLASPLATFTCRCSWATCAVRLSSLSENSALTSRMAALQERVGVGRRARARYGLPPHAGLGSCHAGSEARRGEPPPGAAQAALPLRPPRVPPPAARAPPAVACRAAHLSSSRKLAMTSVSFSSFEAAASFSAATDSPCDRSSCGDG